MDVDRQRIAAVRKLQSLGYVFQRADGSQHLRRRTRQCLSSP
jgi:hypothetical protein